MSSDRIEKVAEWTKGRFIAIAGPFLGSMGQVYKATDTLTKRTVAVKFPLDDDLVKWVAASKTIEREAEVLERFENLWDGLSSADPRRQVIGDLLCHPVSAGWAILSDPEKPGRYLAMDWAEGTNLFNLIKASGPLKTLPLGTILRILSGVARLLAAAHSLGFSNNDVDAKQIYWDERGGKADGTPKPYLKVIDWANAEIFDPQSESAKPRKDIAPFGGLMFSLLTGATDQKIEISNRAQLRERLGASATEVPEALERILAKALEIEGSYANAQELADDLTRSFEGHQEKQDGKLARAKELIEKGEFDKAREIIAEVQRDDPANEDSAEHVTHLVGSKKNQELQGLMQAARGSLEIGKWELARKYLQRAKKLAENKEHADEIERQLGAVDLMADVVKDTELKYRKNAINGYLQNDLSADEILDQLLLGNVFGADKENARSNAFVLHIRRKTSSRFLREDLGDLVNSLREDTQKRPDAGSRRKTVNKIETAVKNLPTVEERGVEEQRKWYLELEDELKKSAGQLEGLSEGSAQKPNSITTRVKELLETLSAADKSGLSGECEEAAAQYMDCLRRDPDNRFFFEQWTLLGKLDKINEELRASLVKTPQERSPIAQNLKEKLKGLSGEYRNSLYIETMRKKVEEQEKFDLEYGFELLAKGQFDMATVFVEDAKRRIRGGDKKLDCLEALIKGVKHLFHERGYPDSKEDEAYHLEQAQKYAEEARKKAGERRESGTLRQVIQVYQELRNDSKLLSERLTQAYKTIEEIESSFGDLNFAQLLTKVLKEDVGQVKTWTDEFYQAREALWELQLPEAKRGFEESLETIPPRLKGILVHKMYLPSAIQVLSQVQKGRAELRRGNYGEAERAVLVAQRGYPDEFRNNARYETFRTYVEQALQAAQTPKQIRSLANQIADTKMPGWGIKTFDYVLGQLEALAALEQEFVEHPQSTGHLERHKRVMEYIREHYNEKEGRQGLVAILREEASDKSRSK